MGEAFFHRRQDFFPGVGEQDPGGMQADAGESGGEQIGALLDPQHRSRHARQHAADELGCRGTVLCIRPRAREFVQRAARQTAAGEGGIDNRDAEGHGAVRHGRAVPLDPGDLAAEAGEGFGTGCR